jgi:hypothetical protein
MKTLTLLLTTAVLGLSSCQKCYDCTYDSGFGTTPDNKNFCGASADVDQQADGLESLGWECQ